MPSDQHKTPPIRELLWHIIRFMKKTFQIIKLIFLFLSILLCLAIPVIGLASTAINYHGICYGFTDGQSACSWLEYARNEIFWASFIFIPLLFLASMIWLFMAALQFIAEIKGKKINKVL